MDYPQKTYHILTEAGVGGSLKIKRNSREQLQREMSFNVNVKF